jgi:hypothetical protein
MKDNNGNPIIPPVVLGYQDVVVGYEYAPTELGKDLLLSHLLFNEDAYPLKTITLSKPSMFELVWKSDYVLLYKVKE